MKFLIAYNSLDENCTHFAYCGEEMVIETETRNINKTVLTSPNLSNYNLLQHLQECHVCFIANHGDSKSIAGDMGDLVSINTNNASFSGKLLYVVSCLCAKELKDNLVSEGLRSFWGYDKELNLWNGYPQYAKSCLSGIKSLLDGKTVKEAKDEMLDQYNKYISELETLYPDNPFLAADLLDNRESLVVYGEDGLTLSDLE